LIPSIALLILAWPHLTVAQDPSFKAHVAVVHILATVRDKEGQLVQDLKRDDFVLEEEGQLQEIEFFSEQSDLPLTLGLLVDTSMSQRRILEEERQASYQFFEQILEREEDRAFVLSFDVDVELLEDLTHSRQRLKKALGDLQVPTEPGRAGIGTVLFDSVFLSADEVLPRESQRTALVVVSDGVDMGSIVSLEEAIATAQRADSIVYSIRYYDSEMYKRSGRGGGGIPGMGRGRGPGPGGNPRSGRKRQPPDGKKILEQLSVETGGRLFEVTKKQTLEQIFQQIQDELRHQYSIGYTPAEGAGSGFRAISLRTRAKGLTVQCRSGYYPPDR
jgi:VWFA-related protein